MKKLFFGLLLLMSVSINIVLAAPSIKIENFVKLPDARDAQVSPDGLHFSVVFRKDDEDILAVMDMKTRKPVSLSRVKGQRYSVDKVYWVNNQRLVYSVAESRAWDKTKFKNGELIGVNADGSNHKMIFGYRSGQGQTGSKIKKKEANNGNQKIIDLLPNDEEHILIAFYPWWLTGNQWSSNPRAKPIIYRLNINNGRKKKLGLLPLPFADAITDNKGEVRFSVGLNDNNEQQIFYRDSMTDDWQKFKLTDFDGSHLSPLSFSKDNESIYLSANVKNGTRGLYLYNLKTQSIKNLFHDEKVDISYYMHDFDTNRVIAVGTDLALPEYFYLEKANKKNKLHKQLKAAFKGSDVVITSATAQGDAVIVFVYSDINGGDYYLFHTNTLKAEYLLSKYKYIDPIHMVKTEAIEFDARDGKKIRGYITKPASTEKLPLVVIPHGGPHGIRDYWGYNWEVQLLANRGYAVLQVNYRGSGGFGLDFQESGYGNWGAAMQDDITDATLAMIKQTNIDPKRMCIYGASYGGYAALMGAVREPELYKCAVGSVGVYNLPMMFEEGDISERKSGLVYLKDVLGENLEEQKKRSPAFNADKIKANILLIHGSRDRRVPIEQAESLKGAFDNINKDYEWLELGNEGHGYYDENNRLTVYKKIVEFLDKNIGSKSLKSS